VVETIRLAFEHSAIVVVRCDSATAPRTCILQALQVSTFHGKYFRSKDNHAHGHSGGPRFCNTGRGPLHQKDLDRLLTGERKLDGCAMEAPLSCNGFGGLHRESSGSRSPGIDSMGESVRATKTMAKKFSIRLLVLLLSPPSSHHHRRRQQQLRLQSMMLLPDPLNNRNEPSSASSTLILPHHPMITAVDVGSSQMTALLRRSSRPKIGVDLSAFHSVRSLQLADQQQENIKHFHRIVVRTTTPQQKKTFSIDQEPTAQICFFHRPYIVNVLRPRCDPFGPPRSDATRPNNRVSPMILIIIAGSGDRRRRPLPQDRPDCQRLKSPNHLAKTFCLRIGPC
jgi:hypothetical protein